MATPERRHLNDQREYAGETVFIPRITVNFIVFGTLHCFWDSGYLCHFSTEIAEIWSPGTFFKDVWAYKISAQNLLYFRSYKIFSGGKSEGKIGLELRELKFITKY